MTTFYEVLALVAFVLVVPLTLFFLGGGSYLSALWCLLAAREFINHLMYDSGRPWLYIGSMNVLLALHYAAEVPEPPSTPALFETCEVVP